MAGKPWIVKKCHYLDLEDFLNKLEKDGIKVERIDFLPKNEQFLVVGREPKKEDLQEKIFTFLDDVIHSRASLLPLPVNTNSEIRLSWPLENKLDALIQILKDK